MSITPRHILLLQSLKGYGNVAVRTVAYEIEQTGVESDKELYALLSRLNTIKKLKADVPSWSDFADASSLAEKLLEKSLNHGIQMLTCYDEAFPQMLHGAVSEKGRSDVPLMIHYKGNLNIVKHPSLAVIGTREPNDAGVQAGKFFASEFAAQGVNIVSGLALGCDSAGHVGALSVGGVTTAILAGGLDKIYPKENTELAQEIIHKGGLLISENPIGTATNKYNLVARDRLQAALADATLVVQTGVKGGTMHAAKATLVSGKTLMVVDYKDSSAEVVKGNLLLKDMGAIGLSSQGWKENQQFYLGKLSR